MKRALSKYHNRPFGIYVMLLVILALVLNLGADVIRITRGQPPETLLVLPGELDRLIYLVIVVFLIILSVGLWRLHTWVWFAAMVTGGLTLFYCIWHALNGGTPYLTMLLVIIMVFYLNLTEVKATFIPRPSEERL